jgi:endonuclease/exonuclease/phosphatase family metal-dependent hydrolase
MRLASFNVENLFDRAKALRAASMGERNPVLEAFSRFNTVSNKVLYEPADKVAMLTDLETLGVLHRSAAGNLRLTTHPFSEWALLRENRGDFIKQPRSGSAEVIANGRNAWIGWVELLPESVNEVAIHMTARVIDDVAADVLAVVEADNRPSLVRFNDEMLNGRYGHVMCIDGNDERGIDVGLLTTDAIDIVSVTSHVDDPDPARPNKTLFSRDCPVYRLSMAGIELWVLVNHLKSQSFTFGDPDPLRTRQATQVRAIYDQLKAAGADLIAIVGDFNKGPTTDAPPQHPTLEALLGPQSPLFDTQELPVFDPGPRPGTFQACGVRQRLDYILVAPELADLVSAGGINRNGLWGNPKNKNPPKLWDVFPPVREDSAHAASDHAAIWIDIDL